MTNLDVSVPMAASRQHRISSRLPAFVPHLLARWTIWRRRRRLLQDTLQELSRLDERTLVDIGVLRSCRQARWVDMGINLPPRLVVECVDGTDMPPSRLNAMNLWGGDLQP